MPGKIALFGVLLTVTTIPLHASPIGVKSMKKDDTGAILQMQTGVLQLQVCGGRTIHVLYSPTGDLPKVPSGFAVQKQPAPDVFDVTETAETATLKAAQDSVVVDKKTGTLTFLGNDGKPFLQEAPDSGKTLTPDQVSELMLLFL